MAYSIFITDYIQTEEGSWVEGSVLTIIHSNPERCWKEWKSLKLTKNQEAYTDLIFCPECRSEVTASGCLPGSCVDAPSNRA